LQIARYRGGAFEDEEPGLAAVLQNLQHVPDLHASDEEDELAEEAWWNQHPEGLENEHPIADNELAPASGDELHQVQDVAGGGGDHENLEPDVADAPQLQVQHGVNVPHAEAQEEVAHVDPIAEQGHQHQPPAMDEHLNGVNEVLGAPAQPGTARWLRENANEPVVEGGKPVMVVVFTMLSILSHKNVHKETFNMIMAAVNELLGPGNLWPR
jgi:hypothetical protein